MYDNGTGPPAQIETVFRWGNAVSDSFCKAVTNAVIVSGKDPSRVEWWETRNSCRKWGSCLSTASNSAFGEIRGSEASALLELLFLSYGTCQEAGEYIGVITPTAFCSRSRWWTRNQATERKFGKRGGMIDGVIQCLFTQKQAGMN